MPNEFIVKNGLIVGGNVVTSGTITINGALAATQSWVTSQGYLTSASLSGYATQSYVTSAIAALVDSAPAALDTLNELAAALGDDANFSTTITNSIASKQSQLNGTGLVRMSGTSVSYDNTTYLISNFGNIEGDHTYGYPSSNGWYKIAEVVFNGACQSYNLWGEYRDTGYFDNSHFRIHITARAECDFPSNNESHAINVNIYGSSTNDTYFSNNVRVVLTQSSSNYRKYELQYYRETWDTGSWRLQTIGWTVYQTSQTAGSATGTPRVYYVSKFSTDNIFVANKISIGTTYAGFAANIAGTTYIIGASAWVNDGYGITNASSPGTGFFPYSDGNSVISSNNTTRLFVNGSTGNIGIGTSSPGKTLDIVGEIRTSGRATFNEYVNTGFVYGNTDLVLAYSGGTTGILINSSGNVGIGTTNPGGKLEVKTGGTSGWDKLVVTNTTLWGDGSTQYVTIGAGGATGIMMFNPHVVWNSASGTAALRLGRSGGVSSGSWYEVGTGASDSFFIAKDGFYQGPQLYINSAGNIGIGTTSPASKLQVAGDIRIQNETGLITDYGPLVGRYNTSQVYVGTGGSYSIVKIARADGGALNVLSGGNVGIGTDSPNYKLDVNGSINIFSGNSLRWGSGDAEIINSGYSLLFKTYNGSSLAEAMRITSGGNVGIGTTNPIYKLQVAGSAYVNGGTLFLDSDQYLRWGNSNQGIVGSNDNHVSIVSGGATRQSIYADGRTYFPGLDLSISNVNSTHGTANYFRGDGSHFVLGTGGTLYLNYGGSSTLLTGSLNVGTALTVNQGIGQNNLVGRPYAVWAAAGTSTGAVIIKFPGNTGNYGMIHAVIDIYEYGGNTVSTIIVGGHNWGSQWYNYGANLVGQTDKQVRVAVVDGAYAIVIGDNSSSWSYGQVVLRKIQNGSYYQNIMNVSEGYTLTQTASLTTSWISGDLRKLTVSGQINASGGDSSQWNAAYSWGNHANAGYLTSVSDVWVNTTGDTMTGNLNFGAISNLGLTWGLNTDAAFIKFISSGNGAGQSYLEIGTQDDSDEEIKFTQSGNVRFYLATDGFLKNGSGYKYVFENGTWGINISGNAATATTFSTNRSNYKGVTDSAVAGQLMWKNYGNGHTIFDASAGTSPDGGSVNNTNSQVAWTGTYPTLMGWNGSNTYGVRVDSARVADSATTASTAGALTSMNISQFTNNSGYVTYGNYSWTSPVFGQYGIKSNLIDNVLYSAADRFEVFRDGVAWNTNCIFNLNYDQNCDVIPTSTSRTYSIVLNTKGNGSSGITYTEGNVYLSFYYVFIPGSVSGRVKDQNGTWRNIDNWTNVANSGSYAVWRGNVPSFNYMVEIEITITSNASNNTWFAQWEYVMGRPGQYELGIINKAQDNSLWRNMYFRDSSNNVQVSIGASGLSTSQNLHISGTSALYFPSYGGGFYMQDSSWIRTVNYKSIWTQTGLLGTDGGLTVGYGGATPPTGGAIISGNVGIGTSSPTQKLHVDGGKGFVRTSSSSWGQFAVVNPVDNEVGLTWAAEGTGYPGIDSTYTRQWIAGLNPFGTGMDRWSLTNKTLGSNTAITVLVGGNVGIGTTSPTEKLHVLGRGIFDGGSGNSSTDAVLYVTKSTNDDWGLYVNNAGLDYGMYTRVSPSAAYAFAIHNGTTWTTRITGNALIYLGEKNAIEGNYDSWLRLNNSNHYASGVYTPGVMRADGGFQVSGSTVWHAGNDGSGSGLDADLLDGIDSGSFLRSDVSDSFSGTLTMAAQRALVPSNYGHGLYGIYSAERYQHVWSMGAGYDLPADGASNGNGGSLYGLAWSYNPDYSYVGSNAQAKPGLNHQLLLMMNGITYTALGNGIWTSGTITTVSHGTSSQWNTAYGWGNHASAGYATTSYVTTQINNLIAGAPGALDTLDELAAALGDDASFATTVTNSIAGKVSKSGDTITGKITFPPAVANRPQFPGGILGLDVGDGNFDIWGISRDYYPSHPTPSSAWGLRWNGDNNDFEFVGAGANRIVLDMDTGNLTIAGFLTESSSLKLKENVETSEGNLEKVVNLRPVTYNKIGSQTKELGLIAEEVATVYPEFVQYDENGEPVGVNYSRLTAALIGAVKELTQRIETLENNG